eukprot:CAMPEP_0183291034 /NCGR_PEP_ID=MMETSP0160_2-20130417/596_1 /TAXON_ID=2839 ORGANISM="Odontella Sinensis, Strain Grunow 1884" /NCGR_SAMPLE_ID=MMETSP0160_2 /ASSEMBLY_ACC=CAM_ASM_000250 /LENGTH=323 /DNA_ID=CAMNT_0025451781 /DNA_START=51 /DNA_END=1022 /DNA_ORIENTATION=+
MKLLFVLPLLACAATAFTIAPAAPRSHRPSSSLLHAAGGGAPQYEKFSATLREAEVVADGSVMLHIDSLDEVRYEPGHVLALEIEAEVEGGAEDLDDKTHRDAKENGGWIRGPYTVSRSTEKSFDVLIKVVGEKSKRFSTAKPGTPLQFGGKFKVPILEGISEGSTKRVVLISTGVGVGPCVGAIEKAVQLGSFPPIDLISSYRTKEEVIYEEHLDALQNEHPERLAWKKVITNEQGRLSASSDNLKALTDTKFGGGVDDTHYHLIGNGQMVSEFKAGLQKAGVPEEKITVEMYFNHKAEVNVEAVGRIASAVMETEAVSVAR